jgi:hypothetical protein
MRKKLLGNQTQRTQSSSGDYLPVATANQFISPLILLLFEQHCYSMADHKRGGRRTRTAALTMPCSSSSSEDNDDDPDYLVDSSNDEADYRAATPDDDGNGAAVVVLPLAADPEGFASFLLTQDDVDAVCKKYGVPMGWYTARPAGDLRASSPPPAGAVCVYAHALEAGMRVPLHPVRCYKVTGTNRKLWGIVHRRWPIRPTTRTATVAIRLFRPNPCYLLLQASR